MSDAHYPRDPSWPPAYPDPDVTLAATTRLEPQPDASPRVSGAPMLPRQTPHSQPRQPQLGGASGLHGPLAENAAAPPPTVIVPARPTNISETGLTLETLEELALKHVVSASVLAGSELAERMRLPLAGVVEDAVNALRRDGLIEHAAGNPTLLGVAGMKLRATERGVQIDRLARERSGYVGPAPVSLKAYERVLRHQAVATRKVKRSEVWRRMAHLVLPDETIDRIGAGLESGGPLFLYGHSGNGKTSAATSLAQMYGSGVFVPHAVEIDDYVVRVFDAGIHHPLPFDAVAPGMKLDERWVFCATPMVRTSVELNLDQLDLHFSPQHHVYDCPIQFKAAGGVLLVDDLGGQRDRVEVILNRVLEPVATGIDYVTTVYGRQIPIPFTSLLVVATPHEPAELLSEAALRRLPCKVHIPDPTEEHFREIFRRSCQKAGVEYSQSGFDYVRDRCYVRAGRKARACHPDELMRLLGAAARYYGAPAQLTPQLIDLAATMYFG